MNEATIKTYVSALRWTSPVKTRPNKGRWIVIIFVRSSRLVIVGYRFCSKAEANRFARKRTTRDTGAVVRRYRRRNWKRRTSSWTSVASESQTWLWVKAAAASPAPTEGAVP